MISSVSPTHGAANSLSTQLPSPRRTCRSSAGPPGCRSSRIEKPRSIHNSPMTLERRKTTSGTKRYATLDDHFNMMFGVSGDEQIMEDQPAAPSRPELSRPLSWHPSSAHFHVPSGATMTEQSPGQDWSRHDSTSTRDSVQSSDFYSISARNSMHPEQMPNYAAHDPHRDSQHSDYSWQEPSRKSYAPSTYSTPATDAMPWYLQEWARNNQSQISNSQQASTDFLPIQHPTATRQGDEQDMEMVDAGRELVGMGLYDAPDPSLSWNVSGLVEGTGKGLKLEETWQPPEEDEDEEELDDASSDDGSVEELPVKEAEQVPVNIKPHTPGNMEGQSFFFDEDENYTKEWWFQQLKHPSMPVRDAGLGYGWL
ncbi:hypothetical protein BDV95DRAFT_489304 [Massariosphaeria phaeospora]|uniref:Uncharacterized protein n=1 Tax=Massariosphaeria phaeospora TaxID=100035 RepID=A0A7C8MI16_9PLEO|nr:hypothetical protein BDV95DRAFT_489304 [Massariosphaeria phaeospora]